MASRLGARMIRPVGRSRPVKPGKPSRARWSLATRPSHRRRRMRLVKPISRWRAPTRSSSVVWGSAEDTTRVASIRSPLSSTTPRASKPCATGSSCTRETRAPERNSTPAARAADSRASVRLAGLRTARPMRRYSIMSTALFGERGAIREPMSPSQLIRALSTSSSKCSSTRSRVGKANWRRNSRMWSRPMRRMDQPTRPKTASSDRGALAIRGMVLSQWGARASAKVSSCSLKAGHAAASSAVAPDRASPWMIRGDPSGPSPTSGIGSDHSRPCDSSSRALATSVEKCPALWATGAANAP